MLFEIEYNFEQCFLYLAPAVFDYETLGAGSEVRVE